MIESVYLPTMREWLNDNPDRRDIYRMYVRTVARYCKWKVPDAVDYFLKKVEIDLVQSAFVLDITSAWLHWAQSKDRGAQRITVLPDLVRDVAKRALKQVEQNGFSYQVFRSLSKLLDRVHDRTLKREISVAMLRMSPSRGQWVKVAVIHLTNAGGEGELESIFRECYSTSTSEQKTGFVSGLRVRMRSLQTLENILSAPGLGDSDLPGVRRVRAAIFMRKNDFHGALGEIKGVLVADPLNLMYHRMASHAYRGLARDRDLSLDQASVDEYMSKAREHERLSRPIDRRRQGRRRFRGHRVRSRE